MDKELKALKIDRGKRAERSRGPRSWLLILVAFFLGSILALIAFRTFFQPNGPAVGAAPAGDVDQKADVTAGGAAPRRRPDEPILIATGYIVPHHRIEVGSKILGKVAWVGVEKSDKVERGQLLVKLDDSEYRAQLAQAEAALAAAEARLAELKAGTRPEEIQRAEAEVRRSRADLANAEREADRLQKLLTSGVISQQQVDDAVARRDMAEASLGVAEKNLELALLGPRQEQIDSARAEVERSRASVQYWQTQIAETEIRAPSSGTVLERISEVGEMVSTAFAGGATVVALADLADLQVELDISQSDFHNIAFENRCEMSPVAYPDRRYVCEVAEIAPEANRQRATIQVKVQILEPDDYLRPEMDAKVTFYPPSTEEHPSDG